MLVVKLTVVASLALLVVAALAGNEPAITILIICLIATAVTAYERRQQAYDIRKQRSRNRRLDYTLTAAAIQDAFVDPADPSYRSMSEIAASFKNH